MIYHNLPERYTEIVIAHDPEVPGLDQVRAAADVAADLGRKESQGQPK